MSEKSILRREFVAGAAAAAALVTAPAVRTRAAHPDHGGHHGTGDMPLAAAAGHCVEVGNACKAHCLAEFAAGRNRLAACAARVDEVITACGALVSLAARGSEHLPAFAAATAEVCRSCEAECRRHAEMHDTCRRCAEACAACLEHCERVAGAKS